MTENTLQKLREKIDVTDKSILDLLEQRLNLTDQIETVKDIGDESVGENLQSLSTHSILTEKIESIFQPIAETSRISRQLKNLKPSPFKKIGILGLGVIGGSIAKVLKSKDFSIIVSTLKRDSEDLTNAGKHGFLDHAYESLTDFVHNNELIIIASPIDTVCDIATAIAKIDVGDKKITVIDVASVKNSISKKFETLTSASIEFLPTHPMAGSEKIGFTGASLSLFIDRPWIIIPHLKSKLETTEKIKAFIESLGSQTLVLDSCQHDEYAAIVSHLIFLISTYLFAYTKSNWESLQIAGTGFETTTRLASGNPKMHAQILQHNTMNIEHELNKFIEFIKSFPVTQENAEQFFVENKKIRDEFINNK